MRAKLTAKHPRPSAPDRAPVRSGSPSARKPARPPAAAAPGAKSEHRGGGKAGKPGSAPRAQANKPKAPAAAPQKAAAAAPAGARGQAAPRSRGEHDDRGQRGDRDGRGQRSEFRAPATDKPRRTADERAPQNRSAGAAPRRMPAKAVDDAARGSRKMGSPVKRSAAERSEPAARAERRDRPARAERDNRSERHPRGEATQRPARTSRSPAAAAKRADTARAPRPSAAREHVAPSGAGTDAAGTMRLSKRMSELGLCSRREADEWIENGWVRVDGVRIDTLGARVRPEQQIEVAADARAAQARQVTILLHKPVGYVSGQAEDGYQPAITLITQANRWDGDRAPARFAPSHLRALAPAGRLDIDSTGLLVLTQDGRIAKLLIGEHSGVEKEYLVRVTYGERTTDIDRHFPAEQLALLRHGLSLDDAPLKPAKVSWQNGEQLRFVLREGKKRQIRRMCELVGLQVVGLKRVRMGSVTLGALPQGQWRYLLPDEAF